MTQIVCANIFNRGRSNSIWDIKNVEAQIFPSSPFYPVDWNAMFSIEKRQLQLYITNVSDEFDLGWVKQSSE